MCRQLRGSAILKAGPPDISTRTSRASIAPCRLVIATTRSQQQYTRVTGIPTRFGKDPDFVALGGHLEGETDKHLRSGPPSRSLGLRLRAYTFQSTPHVSQHAPTRTDGQRPVRVRGGVSVLQPTASQRCAGTTVPVRTASGPEHGHGPSEHVIARQGAVRRALRVYASCAVVAAQGGRECPSRPPTSLRFGAWTLTSPRAALYTQIRPFSARARMFGEFQIRAQRTMLPFDSWTRVSARLSRSSV